MENSIENLPEDKPLTKKQLNQGATHTWNKEIQYTSMALLPAAAIAAYAGRPELALAAGAFGVAGLGVPTLLKALKGKTESKKR